MRKHNTTLRKIALVKQLAAKYYEPGNQARSYFQVWRLYVNNVYPCRYETFIRWLNTDLTQLEQGGEDPGARKQLKLFENETDR